MERKKGAVDVILISEWYHTFCKQPNFNVQSVTKRSSPGLVCQGTLQHYGDWIDRLWIEDWIVTG